MTKQEEIKENLQLMGFYSDNYEYWERAKVVTLTAKGVDRILEYLHSKGVVIKIGIDNYSREVLVGRIVADSPCTIEVPLFEPLIKES